MLGAVPVKFSSVNLGYLSRMSRTARILVTAVLATSLAGCGSDNTSSADIQEARTEAAAQQKLKDKQAELERKVNELKKQNGSGKTETVVVTSGSGGTSTQPSSSSGGTRTFSAPSGNVTCQVTSSTAACTVASINTTFVLNASGTATREAGTRFPRGSGSPAGYGTTVTEGSVTCSIPTSSQASGITCVNSATGHGFEASRQPERQKTY